MPIFEYRCRKCAEEFERIVFESDTDKQDCPECGSADTKKVVSVFASCGLSKDTGGCGPSSGGFS